MSSIGRTSYITQSLKPILTPLLLILSLVLIWTCFETFLLYMLKMIVDSFSILDTLNMNILPYLGAFIIIIFFIETPMRVANFLHAKVLPKSAFILREKLADKLLNKELLFFNNEKIGNLVSRIAGLPQAVENIIKVLLYGVIAGSFSFFVTIVLVALNLGTIAIYFIIWYLLMMIVGAYFIKKTITFSQSYAHRINIANAELTELLQNILNIKVAAKESFESNRIKQFFLSIYNSQTKLEVLSFKADTIRSVISGLLLIGLFGFTMLKVSASLASMGDLVFVISSAFIARRDIWRVSLQLTEIYKDFGFIKEVEMIMQSENQSNFNQKVIKSIESIKLDSVSFGFNDNPLVLKNINLEIKKGMKVALVGSSGAGKTTLAKVLQGIYKVEKGHILINNQNQNKFTNQSILEHTTYIPQEPVLFNRSIRENISYLSGKLDNKLLAEVAKIALCDDYIEALPQKYDTQLINLGNNLSAGQKQRIAVARALCSKAKWLIFDEPSSALDIKTEVRLIKNLLAYCKDRTLIIITHNPEIMKSMDKILLLQDGYIIAEGSHNDLSKKSKQYKHFINRVQNGKKNH